MTDTLVPYTSFSIAAEVEEFIRTLDRSPETRRSYGSSLKTFQAFLAQGQHGTPRDIILNYKTDRLATCSAATVTRDLAALRAIIQFLMAEGRLSEDPMATIRSPKGSKNFKRGALSKEQAIALVESAEGPSLRACRDSAIIALMLRAGLRDCEVVRANIDNLKEMNGVRVLWIHGKGRDSADEWVVVNPRCAVAIDRYIAIRGIPQGGIQQDAPLFVACDGRGDGRLSTRQVNRIVTSHLQVIGVKSADVTSHSLRHTSATLALESGVPLSSIQAMLRHSDPRTTARYAHVRNRTEAGAELALDF